MPLDELWYAVGSGYLELVHLDDGAPTVLAVVTEFEPRVSDAVIRRPSQLLWGTEQATVNYRRPNGVAESCE